MKKNIKLYLLTIFTFSLAICGFYFNFFNTSIDYLEYSTDISVKYQSVGNKIIEDNVVLNYQNDFNNEEIVGELSIPNTSLKVPVSHTNNNSFYLDHLVDKSYSTLGSEFLDYRTNITDKKIIIYGHNSQNINTQFHMLEKYLDKTYYDDNKYIYFKSLNYEFHYEIFSVYIAKNDLSHFNLNFNDDEYFSHLNWLKNQSIYDTGVEVMNDDNILVLQTCYFQPMHSYLIIVAKKI